jgi:ubiquinone/menaquinone biosynthesis C-methylase UbiE
MEPHTDLPWTGERFVPGVRGETEIEHLHRYALARRLASGKRVLDIACGEGYGTNLLAEVALSAIGVDIEISVVEHARHKYRRSNLEFRQGSCTAIPLPDGSIDLAISFETLEHHAEHEAMLAELYRVMSPDGVLIISTPDKLYYSDERHYRNEFHVRELYAAEFRQLIHDHFRHVSFCGQKMVYGSLVTSADEGGPFVSFSGNTETVAENIALPTPLYLIAVASNNPFSFFLPASLFDGTQASIEEANTLRQMLAETRDQLSRTSLQLEAVYTSIYWRLTLPLRLVRRAVKLIFQV